jgi:hypothetical protein
MGNLNQPLLFPSYGFSHSDALTIRPVATQRVLEKENAEAF